jgi:DNA (cytosine-5)-methyltransferase 1
MYWDNRGCRRKPHDLSSFLSERSVKLLSLFTGAGGLDLGLEKAGFDVVGCVELDADARATIKHNRPSWPTLDIPDGDPGDILALPAEALFEYFHRDPGEVSLLAGGPPCQPFSKASYWVNGEVRGMADPRAKTLHAYFRVLEVALPQMMLLENVQGITFNSKERPDEEKALGVLGAALEGINTRHGTSYVPHVLHLDAVDYGVPQKRKRVFVFADRDGRKLNSPSTTHFAGAGAGRLRWTSAWDAIGEFDQPDFDPALAPTGYWADLLASIPEGQNYQFHTPRNAGEPLFGWRTKYWTFLLKLAKCKPSWTLQAMPGPATGPFHWRNRRLSIEELARLQTFPEGYVIQGRYRSAVRQLGNAVPAAIGELLGLEIRRQLLGHRVRRTLRLLPAQRDDCPQFDEPARVPSKYLHLRARHEEHPGTGRGPRAMRRKREAEQGQPEFPKAA